MTGMLDDDVREAAERSVLCWLASADERGQPNVSPKEVFAVADDEHIVVANIASPRSAANLRVNGQVCLSFIDIFAQKGFKIIGTARDVPPSPPEYARWEAPLRAMTGDRFPIRSVFVIRALAVEPILAPSYWLHPAETTEASQIRAALRTYGVTRESGDA